MHGQGSDRRNDARSTAFKVSASESIYKGPCELSTWFCTGSVCAAEVCVDRERDHRIVLARAFPFPLHANRSELEQFPLERKNIKGTATPLLAMAGVDTELTLAFSWSSSISEPRSPTH